MTFIEWVKENGLEGERVLCIPDIIYYAEQAWNAAVRETTELLKMKQDK